MDVKVVQTDNWNKDGMTPIGFTIEWIGLLPKPAQIGPENGCKKQGDNADFNPGGCGKPEIQLLVAFIRRRDITQARLTADGAQKNTLRVRLCAKNASVAATAKKMKFRLR
jgi:hypothetical protein